MGTPTKKTKYEFEPLEFSLEESTTDPDLRHAIQITHKFLSVPALIECIKIIIEDDDDSETQILSKWRTCVRKLRDTKVKFMPRPRNGKLSTSWIDRVDKDGDSIVEIAVHYFFKHRLQRLKEMLNPSELASKSTRTTSMVLRSAKKEVKQPTKEEIEKEIRMIIVFIGIAIFHEVAHLLIRFSGKEKTPLKFLVYRSSPDAGDYMENQAFSGTVNIFASPEKGQWSINDIYKGIGRINYTRKEKITFVFSDEWIKNVYNLAYTNLKCYVVPLYMKDASSVSHTKSLNRHEEDEDNAEKAKVITAKDMVDLEDLGVAKCGVHLDD